jgi:hypothetical protein
MPDLAVAQATMIVIPDRRSKTRKPRMSVVIAIDPDIAVRIAIQPPVVMVIPGQMENRRGVMPDVLRRDVSFAVAVVAPRVRSTQLCVAAGKEQ